MTTAHYVYPAFKSVWDDVDNGNLHALSTSASLAACINEKQRYVAGFGSWFLAALRTMLTSIDRCLAPLQRCHAFIPRLPAKKRLCCALFIAMRRRSKHRHALPLPCLLVCVPDLHTVCVRIECKNVTPLYVSCLHAGKVCACVRVFMRTPILFLRNLLSCLP